MKKLLITISILSIVFISCSKQDYHDLVFQIDETNYLVDTTYNIEKKINTIIVDTITHEMDTVIYYDTTIYYDTNFRTKKIYLFEDRGFNFSKSFESFKEGSTLITTNNDIIYCKQMSISQQKNNVPLSGILYGKYIAIIYCYDDINAWYFYKKITVEPSYKRQNYKYKLTVFDNEKNKRSFIEK